MSSHDPSPSGRLAGHSIGRALDLPAGPLYDDLRQVIAAIDRVHGTHDLPRIPVRYVFGMVDRGRFLFDPKTGEPISILLRPDVRHRSFALLHEIGHFLDLAALGSGPDFGTVVGSKFLDWALTVRESTAFRTLAEFVLQGSARIIDPDDPDRSMPLNPRELAVIEKWLQPEELWARSYAQFVASRSESPDLVAGLDQSRTRSRGRVYYPRQWDDDDFVLIGTAIDQLLVAQGWQ
jgi:hypothetical protein